MKNTKSLEMVEIRTIRKRQNETVQRYKFIRDGLLSRYDDSSTRDVDKELCFLRKPARCPRPDKSIGTETIQLASFGTIKISEIQSKKWITLSLSLEHDFYAQWNFLLGNKNCRNFFGNINYTTTFPTEFKRFSSCHCVINNRSCIK